MSLMDPDHPDVVKRWLACLGCGSKIWTDRCHRICRKCRRRNAAWPKRHSHRVSLPSGASFGDGRSRGFDD